MTIQIPAKETAQYGCVIPIFIAENDKPETLRKFLSEAGKQVATVIMRTWLAHPGSYNVDITVSMTKKEA